MPILIIFSRGGGYMRGRGYVQGVISWNLISSSFPLLAALAIAYCSKNEKYRVYCCIVTAFIHSVDG